jgi:pilus assembly protein CpaE
MTTDGGAQIRVLLLTDSEDTARLLQSLLAADPGFLVQREPAAAGAALNGLARHRPDVVVLCDVLEEPALTLSAHDAATPELAKIVILPEGDVRGAQACSLAGPAVTLFKPFDHATLVAAIRQAHARERRHRLAATGQSVTAARQQKPRVVAIHGAKGGVGATTITVNLAAALRRLTERRVAVVDADLLCGDVGVLLDLPPDRGLVELLPSLGDLDAESVDDHFQEHESGIFVLGAPEQIQRAESVGPEDVARTLVTLRPYFDYQVVDTPSGLTPATLAVFDEADLVVVVVTPELPALRNAARLLRLASQLGYASEKLLVALNRAETSRLINRGVVEEHLQRAVPVEIPSDGRTVIDVMNAGELLLKSRPNSRAAECISELAREVARRFGWNPLATQSLAATGAEAAPPAAPARFGRMGWRLLRRRDTTSEAA